MYSESPAIEYSAAEGGRKCDRVAVCVCAVSPWRGLLISLLPYQATVATVVNPQTAGMWIAKFSQPRIQDHISLVPVLT